MTPKREIESAADGNAFRVWIQSVPGFAISPGRETADRTISRAQSWSSAHPGETGEGCQCDSLNRLNHKKPSIARRGSNCSTPN